MTIISAPRAIAAPPQRYSVTRTSSPTPGGRQIALTPGRHPATTETPPKQASDTESVLRALALCALEVIAGTRDVDQLSRWVTEEVYRQLHVRAVLAARARRAKETRAMRPTFQVHSVRESELPSGAIEAVVVVQFRARTRAVAIRLEPLDQRWRASALTVL